MTTSKTILKDLFKLKSELETKELYPLTLKELIEKVQENIRSESLPNTTTKRRYNAIKRFLSQNHLKSRPILQFTHLENGYQVFTDSYALFRFYNDEIIKQLPQTTDENAQNLTPYPNTARLCEGVFNSTLKSDFYNIKDIKNDIRTTENNYIDIELNHEQNARLEKNLLKRFIDIMGFKNNEKIQFNYMGFSYPGYTVRPVAVVATDKEGLILPLRVE